MLHGSGTFALIALPMIFNFLGKNHLFLQISLGMYLISFDTVRLFGNKKVLVLRKIFETVLAT